MFTNRLSSTFVLRLALVVDLVSFAVTRTRSESLEPVVQPHLRIPLLVMCRHTCTRYLWVRYTGTDSNTECLELQFNPGVRMPRAHAAF